MPETTLNLAYVTGQAIAFAEAALGGVAFALLLVLLARARLWPKGRVARHALALPAVAAALAAAHMTASRLGVLPAGMGRGRFVLVAIWLYWGAFVWPCLVWLDARRLRALRGGRWLLGFALVAPLVALWALFVEPDRLEAEPVELRFPEVAGEPIRVAHVSDLQLVDLGGRELALIRAVEEFRPHLVIMTGDYVAGSHDLETEVAAARAVVSRFHPSHGIWATTSDSNDDRTALRIFAGLGVHYLLNKSETVEVLGTKVRIGGLNHHYPLWEPLRRDSVPEELFLVACHHPDFAWDCRERAPLADLFLCGHTHGGQLQIPFFGPLVTLTNRTPRHVAAGGVFKTEDGMPILLSRGVGMEGDYSPRFRLFCRPHLFLLTLAPTGPKPPAQADPAAVRRSASRRHATPRAFQPRTRYGAHSTFRGSQ